MNLKDALKFQRSSFNDVLKIVFKTIIVRTSSFIAGMKCIDVLMY